MDTLLQTETNPVNIGLLFVCLFLTSGVGELVSGLFIKVTVNRFKCFPFLFFMRLRYQFLQPFNL